MRTASRAELDQAARNAAAVLCDWDGCLAIDNRLQPGVADFLRQARRIAIVSNNSTMSREVCQRLLASEDIRLPLQHIHLAGQTLIEMAAASFGDRPVHLVGNQQMRRLARKFGLKLAREEVDAVLVLRNPGFDYDQLARAAHQVRGGAQFWIANPDMHHPSCGRLMPETGALAAAIAAAAGRGPDRVIGKPEPHLFRQALAALALAPDQVLMIGDNPTTDIAGGQSADIASLLVGSETWRRDTTRTACAQPAEASPGTSSASGRSASKLAIG